MLAVAVLVGCEMLGLQVFMFAGSGSFGGLVSSLPHLPFPDNSGRSMSPSVAQEMLVVLLWAYLCKQSTSIPGSVGGSCCGHVYVRSPPVAQEVLAGFCCGHCQKLDRSHSRFF